jgi:4-hydroxybenzoate polyprenyltransferase
MRFALVQRAHAFLELIKFEHTIFALPFAYLGMVLAAGGWPTWGQFLWITLAMAAARTLGMSANRLADRWIDGRNPRTAGRALATGAIRPGTVWLGMFVSAGVLTIGAAALGPLPFRLLPGAFVFLLFYPFTKRFTWLSHWILGATDALAPLGAWAAIRGTLTSSGDAPAWLLFLAVTFWIAGFDLIYACQDIEVDRREGLYSVPAQFGPALALRLSAACHALTTVLLVLIGLGMHLNFVYALGVVAAGGLLAYEHSLVRPDDLSRINTAFFDVNSVISLTLFAATLTSVLMA